MPNETNLTTSGDSVAVYWFEYAHDLQELADKVDRFILNISGTQERAYLRSCAKQIRWYASDIGTAFAIKRLRDLNKELEELKKAIGNANKLLSSTDDTRGVISGLVKVVSVIVGIVGLTVVL